MYKFEEEFVKYCGTDYAIFLSSGTQALQYSLLAVGLKTCDSMLTTPLSFIAMANAALHAGGVPQFADIDDKTYTINPRLFEKRIDKGYHSRAYIRLSGRHGSYS